MNPGHEVDALLATYGPDGADVTSEQRERAHAAAEAVARLYSDEGDEELLREALLGAVMIVLEEDGIKGAGTLWHEARDQADRAHAYLRGALAAYPGSERGASLLAGVSRETVRKARGT